MSGGGKTQTSTSSVQIPPEVLARYNAVNARAENVASTPFQAYSYDPSAFVAPMTETQNQAIDQIKQTSGMAQPYFQAGAAATLGGMGPANLGELDTNKYMSPYLQNVVQSTADILGQQNRQDMSGALGTAIQSGAGFGDRSGIAAANLNRQQILGMGSTISNILNQGYTQAQNVAQQQQSADLASRQANLARLLQGGQSIGQLGAGAQGAGVAGGQALLGAGTQQQQTEQAGLSSLYNQYQQERAYPFQTTQFLGNIGMGTGALSGATTTETKPAGFFSGLKRGGKVIEDVGYRRGGLVPESMGGHVSAGHMGEGYADGGSPQMDYATMVIQQLFGGASTAGGPYGQGNTAIGMGGFVPPATLPIGQLNAPKISQSAPQTSISDLVDTGGKLYEGAENVGKWWEENNPSPPVIDENDPQFTNWDRAAGGRTTRTGLAAGGMPYDPQNTGYVPDNAPKETPELLQPKGPSQTQSGLSKVADIAKIVGAFMANGGVAGRHGYAGGGRPEDFQRVIEAAEAERQRLLEANEAGRQSVLDAAEAGRQSVLDAAEARRQSVLAGASTFDSSQQNLPPGGVAAPARVQGLSFNPNASVQGGQTENSAYVAPTRVQGLSFNPNASVQGAQTENAAYVSPAEAEFLRQLRAAPPNLAVATPAGLSAADAERIRREHYEKLYANQPVEQIVEDPNREYVTNRRFGQPTSVQGVQTEAAPTPIRLTKAEAMRNPFEYPDTATELFGPEDPDASPLTKTGRAVEGFSSALLPWLGNAYVNYIGQPLVQATDFLTMRGPDYRAAYDENPPTTAITPGLKPAGEIPLGDVMSAGSNAVATGEVPAAATREGLAGAALPAPVTDAIVAADPAQTDLTSGVTPLTSSPGVANAAEPVVEPQPGLVAGTGAGAGAGAVTPAVAAGAGSSENQPLNVRNNNPGNIKDGGFARSQPGYVGNNGEFAVFKTPEDGSNAQTALLGSYIDRGYDTISKIVNRWAPAGAPGNSVESTNNYVAYVAKKAGIDPNQPLTKADIPKILAAQAEFEGGYTAGGGGGGGGTLGDAAITSPDVTDTRPDGGRNDQPAPGLGGKNFFEQMIDKAGGPENIILPFLSGLGRMAGSQSRFLGTAILEGIGGGAEAYMNRQKQLADIGMTEATTRGFDIENVKRSLQVTTQGNIMWTVEGPMNAFDYFRLKREDRAPELLGYIPGQPDQSGTNAPSGEAVTPRGTELPAGINFGDKSMDFANNETQVANGLTGGAGYDLALEATKTYQGAVNAAAAAARETDTLTSEMAVNLANVIAAKPGPLSSAGAGFNARADIVNFLNTTARAFNLDLQFSEADEQSAISQKVQRLIAAQSAAGADQNSNATFTALANALPNPEMPHDAIAELTASMLVNNKRSKARQWHMNKYKQNSGGLLADAGFAFNQDNPATNDMQAKEAIKNFMLKDPDIFAGIMKGSYTAQAVDEMFQQSVGIPGMSGYLMGGI